MPDPTLLDDNGNPIQSGSQGLLDDNGNPIGSSSPSIDLKAPPAQPGMLSEAYQGAKETVGGLWDMMKGGPPAQNINDLKNLNLHPMEDSIVQSAKNAAGSLSDAAISSGMVPDKMMRGVSTPKYNTLQNLGLAGADVADMAGLPARQALTDAYEGHAARGVGRLAAGGAILYGMGRAHAPEAAKVMETPDIAPKPPEMPPAVASKFDAKEGAYILPDKGTSGSAKPGLTNKGLPKDTTVKPLYTATQKLDINFANDVDKSMWIVSTSQPGPKYNSALSYLTEQTGVSPERAVELSKEFNNYVKLEMKGKESGAHDMPAVYGAGMEDAQEMRRPKDGPYGSLPEDARQSPYGDEYAGAEEFPDGTGNEPIISFPNEGRPRDEFGHRILPESLPNRGLKLVKDEPQEMRVPGPVNPKTGRSNIALGGADPEAITMLQSLYSRDRFGTVLKESIQNSSDEHAISGKKTPIRILWGENDQHPVTKEPAKSFTIRDTGRGLTPDQIYTVLTDVGKSGKREEGKAAGGFGFAKLAPTTLGDYVRMESTVKEGGHNVKYTFEGTPEQLKNQVKGVPLNAETTKAPTGLKVKTWFPEDKHIHYENYIKDLGETSHGLGTTIEHAANYSPNTNAHDKWLDFQNNPNKWDETPNNVNTITPPAPETLQASLDVPGAKINLHFNDVPENVTKKYTVALLNKGLFQSHVEGASFPGAIKGLPSKVIADIIATVEEGHPDYPYTLSREALNSKFVKPIQDTLNARFKDIIEEQQAERARKLQHVYDSMPVLEAGTRRAFHVYDQGSRYTPEELNKLLDHPVMKEVAYNLDQIAHEALQAADKIPNSKYVPSNKVQKLGFLMAAPDDKGTVFGIHIPDPSSQGNRSAILLNLGEHLKSALKTDDPLNDLAADVLTTITHETGHTEPIAFGDPHGAKFGERVDLTNRFIGAKGAISLNQRLLTLFGDKNGNIRPELTEFLRGYEESRGREARSEDALLGTGIKSQRQANGPPRIPTEGEANRSDSGGPKKPSFKRELFELARGASAAWDVSAPFNQGFGMIGTREWFKAWKPMVQALGSEKAFEKTQSQIERLPVVEDGIAHESGLALMDLSANLNRREELLKSTWAEKIPGIRASNRAYTAYLNSLRANAFQRLYDSMPPELQKEPYHVKEMASFVNDATGRGRHEYGLSKGNLQNIPVVGKLLPDKEVGATLNMERYSKALNDIYFAPRKTSATVRMLNPGTYITLPPMIRNQYLKSLLRMGVAYTAINTLMQGLGGETTSDPTNSDFGKFKFGRGFRVNTPGGFGPFLVLAARIASGDMTSSDNGKTRRLGKGFKGWTVKDLAEQFGSNKLHPTLRMAYDLADASDYKPYSVFDRTLQTYTPMVAQDLATILKNDPSLLPGIIPSAVGMGTQYYEKGMNKNVFVPQENDIQIKGSPFRWAYDKMNGGN